ncbi:MAG: VENN motif pre-toxin domain-containing protein [Sulfurovaceae bacterium]|nr:VENN motif pre-toxin domain-containing protein [Sulfurovaceae bacterium]
MSCHLSFTPLSSHTKNLIVGSVSGQSNTQLTTNALAPYASALIGDTFDHTDDPNKAAQLLSHAILGAIIARANGGNEYSGATSAVVSEETSMILAKELYPNAFDDNGNFDRSKLSEEQANGILALSSAIGAFTSGLSGGSVYDASVGGFIGQNAVEENNLSKDELALKKFRIAMCHGESFCTGYEIMKFDTLSDYNQMLSVGNGAVNIYNGLDNSITRMWNNSPWYAKGTLITAGGIVLLPAVEIVGGRTINYAYMNPDKVLLGYGVIGVLDGAYGGTAPNDTASSLGKLLNELGILP